MIAAVRRNIVDIAAQGRANDFNTAEQVFFALESLSYTLGDRRRLTAALDLVFAEVEDDADFSPASFTATVRNIRGEF